MLHHIPNIPFAHVLQCWNIPMDGCGIYIAGNGNAHCVQLKLNADGK